MAAKIAADDNPKAALRKQVVAARDALKPEARRDLSRRITQQLIGLDAYRNAASVLAYMSLGSEFETNLFIADVLAGGKHLCLPRVNRDKHALEVHVVTDLDRDLQSGVWGIQEPRADICPRASLERIDFVLVPGVAFTPRCERLGYGGGFYDRLIAQLAHRPPLVAAAFALQVCAEIPVGAGDQRIDLVITESSSYCAC